MTGRIDDASLWWAAQRRRYNITIVVVGAVCFDLYLVLAAGQPDVELTIFAYDPASNAFGSYNPDGTTKTFFKPASGPHDWSKQPGTAPWSP